VVNKCSVVQLIVMLVLVDAWWMLMGKLHVTHSSYRCDIHLGVYVYMSCHL